MAFFGLYVSSKFWLKYTENPKGLADLLATATFYFLMTLVTFYPQFHAV